LNKNQIAKKYSRAILNTVKLSDVPLVIEELKAFSSLIEKNRRLKLLFGGQIFTDEEKGKAFEAIRPSLKFNAGTEKFLGLVIAQGYLAAMKEIITYTISIYNERQKKATAVVVSPVSLDKGYSDRLKAALKNLINRDIELENEIDPSLLGGFIVRVGSTIYDSSVKGQLRLLKSELMR
jgi:F-type H+-transporting ATPase subunit delta